MRNKRGGAVSRAVTIGTAAIALLAGALSGPAVAGMLQAAVPNYVVKNVPPGPAQAWNVGDTFTGTITLANFSTSPNDQHYINVDTILFTPSCGASTDGVCDSLPDKRDPGVFAITNPVGTGACAGSTFGISVFDADSGELQFTPTPAFQLGASDLTVEPNLQLICTITFDVEVLRKPTAGKVYSGPNGPGTQALARAQFSDAETDEIGTANGSTEAWIIGPALAITKAPVSGAIFAGQNATFTITVTNNGDGPATDVTITDTLPTGVTWTLNPAVTGCSISAGPPQVLTCTLPGPIAASGGTQQIVVTAPTTTETPQCLTAGPFLNTATITGTNGQDINDINSNQASISCTQIISNLTATKSDGTGTYTPGTQTVYTIVITNNGPSTATNAVVSDTRPSQVTTWQWQCSGGTGSGCDGTVGFVSTSPFTDTVTMTVGQTIRYVVTANIDPSATGNLVNTVTAVPTQGETGSATDTDTPAPVTNLVISKTNGQSSVTYGTNTVYTVTVQNNGPSTSTGAILVDPAVSGLTKVSVACVAGNTCSSPPSVGQLEGGAFALPTIPVGQTYVIAITATVTSITGSVTNSASVTPPDEPPTTSTGSGCTTSGGITRVFTDATDTCTSSDTDSVSYWSYSVLKQASSATPTPGSPLSFTITVTNNGPADADGTIVTDVIPAGFNASSATCTSGPSCPGGDLLGQLNGAGVTLTDFPAGSSYVFVVEGTFVQQQGSLTNTATACPPSVLAGQVSCQDGSTTVTVPGDEVPVPTLSEYALIALMLMMAAAGAMRTRRGRR